MKKIYLLLFVLTFSNCAKEDYEPVPTDKIELGKLIFNDTNLSNPIGQSCASCHSPETGFSDPTHRTVSEGAVSNTFANRNAPALSYNVFASSRYYNIVDETFIGGFFLDGRTNSLQEQAIHPFINSLEMNNGTILNVVSKIKNASYYSKLVSIYGNSTSDAEIMNFVVDAIATFEKSDEMNPFTSKYDYYLQGRATLTTEERKGLVLFNGKANCAACHINEPDPIKKKILFTDFSYDNIGIPRNNFNPFYSQTSNPQGNTFVDLGIGAIVSQSIHNGKFKVPSLRNIAISAPYFHNGSIQTLEKAVRFYNVRDLNTGEFDPPEYNQNVNTDELGNLSLTVEEEQNLVAFLKTLTDNYHNP